MTILFVADGRPVQAQSVGQGWEVRVLLDGSRHQTRRVRSLLTRRATAALAAPALGPGFLGFLQKREVVGDWPGFGPQTPPPGAATLAGLPHEADNEVRSSDRMGFHRFERLELPLAPGAEWREPGYETPTWTVVLRDQGETVLSLSAPFRLPLLPERIRIQNQDILWALHHGPSGDVDWALAVGFVGGSTSVYWEALWRADGVTDPATVNEALEGAPWGLMRHVLSRYRTRDSWTPLGALKTTLASARYNQVEGGSLEVPAWLDVTSTVRLRGWARMSTSSYPLTGGIGATLDHWPANWGLDVYRKLQDANRWEPSETSKGNSFSAFLHGVDSGHYFTASGASLWWERQHGMTTWRMELFSESDRTAMPRTDYALFPNDSSELPAGLEAEDGDYYGLRGVFEHQWGLETANGVLLSRLWFGTAGGDRSFTTLGGTVDALKTWGWWAAGVRVAGGRVFGDAPVQREFFLGGITTVRGFDPAKEQGPAVAFSRLEMGFGPSAVRLMAFGDAGWAGEAGNLEHLASAGLGVSFAEGLFRLDVAKPVSGGTGLKLYFTGNGLL